MLKADTNHSPAESPNEPLNEITTGISVILPCYNEEEHVVKTGVTRILEMLKLLHIPYEIILVDDGSTNSTRLFIEQAIQGHPQIPIIKIENPKNLGRGGAVMEGIKASRYSVVGYLDIDLEVGSQYIPSFYSAIGEGADLVVAQRIYKIHLTPAGILRLIMSKGYIWFSQRMLGLSYPDTEAGYKFFRRDKVLPLLNQVKDRHWFWDTEMVVRGHDAGWKILFLPCLFLRRKDKKSSVRVLRDTLAYLKAILKFKKERSLK